MSQSSNPIHPQPFDGAGRTYKLAAKGLDGDEIRVEDYWDRVAGKSWMISDGNPAALKYGMRAGFNGLPLDDEVVYGKIGAFGHLVHVSELGEVTEGGAR
jgi:hypothetical protein